MQGNVIIGVEGKFNVRVNVKVMNVRVNNVNLTSKPTSLLVSTTIYSAS